MTLTTDTASVIYLLPNIPLPDNFAVHIGGSATKSTTLRPLQSDPLLQIPLLLELLSFLVFYIMFSRRLFLSSVRSILQLESKALACQAVFSTRTTQFRMASSLPPLPIFSALASHESSSTAVVHSASGRSFTYGQLLQDVATAKDKLKLDAGSKSLEGERIAFLVENSYDYVGADTMEFQLMQRAVLTCEK